MSGISSFAPTTQSSKARIRMIPKSWASQFTLPPGQPQQHVVFAGHPYNNHVYCQLDDFHIFMFEGKFCEIIDILMELGATKIEVRHVIGWGREFSEKLGVSIPKASINQESSLTNKTHSEILYKAEFGQTESVALPETAIWLPHEKTWQQFVKGRIKHRLRTFNLKLQYQQDFGVNVSLKSEIEKSGFDVGGKFVDHQETIWEIKGEFEIH